MYFDIGANIGKWALENISKTNKIISIEASPITFEKLKKNCNNPNIILLNYAVCDNSGNDITFYHANADTLSTLNKTWLDDTKSRFYKYTKFHEIICKTITIDSLIDIYGKPDLIKIDVEGGEYQCVKSLTQKVDLLCFEWAAEMLDVANNCIDYLYNLGFNKFYIQDTDVYTFRPTEFYDINVIKEKLNKTTPKKDWGMIWCA